MSADPIDIVMLTYNRLDHLIATVESLEAGTPEEYRLIAVDNASGPDVRNWLAANEHRFARVLRLPRNEHVPAFQHGIEVTSSDPFIVTDPDLVVPQLEPSWLARMLAILNAHPDFGLIGMGLEQRNRPRVLSPEQIPAGTIVDNDLVRGPVGTWFQVIRRQALRVPYRSDGETCAAVEAAGYRVGWTRSLRAVHLGWDDWRLHPGHLGNKSASFYPSYGEISIVDRPPTQVELATAGPVIAETRAAGVPDTAVLELAWDSPAVAAAVPQATAVVAPPLPLSLGPGAAGAVVLIDPPAAFARALIAEAARVAARLVVAVADLDVFGADSAVALAPSGWTGREAPVADPLVASIARRLDEDRSLSVDLSWDVLEHRERWLSMYASGAFGDASRRLWIWEPAQPSDPCTQVRLLAPLERWRPDPGIGPTQKRMSTGERVHERLASLRHRAAITQAKLRRRRRR